MKENVVDFRTCDKTNPFNNNGLGDIMLGLAMVHSLSKKNPDKIYRLVLPPHMIQWGRLFWPHCIEDLRQVEPGESQIWMTTNHWQYRIDPLAEKNGTNRALEVARDLGVDLVMPEVTCDEAAKAKLKADWLRTCTKGRLDPFARVVAMSPFSTNPPRDWPLHHWIRLASLFMKAGFVPIILGGAHDIERARVIPGVAACNKKPADVVAILDKAAMTIGGDSGIAHLSGFIRQHTIAVCGPTNGQVVFGHYANVLPLQSQKACSPCHFNAQGFRYSTQQFAHGPWCHNVCDALCEIKADFVFERAMSLINKKNVDEAEKRGTKVA